MKNCSLLTLAIVLCSIAACKGLRLTMHQDPPVLPQRPAVCGVLRCEESTSPPTNSEAGSKHTDTWNSFNTIDSITLFRVFPGDSSSNVPDRHEVLVALVSQDQSVKDKTKSTQNKGVLNSKGATLSFDLNEQDDCNAEFICEVKGVSSQGGKLVRTTTLQSRPDYSLGIQRQDGSLMSVMFVQLLSQIQQLASKLDTLESRVEDKSHAQILEKLSQLELKVSALGIAGTPSRPEPAANTYGSLEMLVKELHRDHRHNIEEFCRNTDEVQHALANVSASLASMESRQSSYLVSPCPQLNLTEALAQIDWEISTSRLLNETLSSQEELLNTTRQLESTVVDYNRTVANPASGSDTNLSERFEPKPCEKGMEHVQPQNSSFPYPVIQPSSESGLSVEYLCDTLTDEGGWIVIQRRTTGNTNFTRSWEDYKRGFGPLYDDFWLGNENIHTLTSKGSWELRVDIRRKDDAAYAIYADFSIENEQDDYRLGLGDHSGTLRDSLTSRHNNKQFSTFDSDNDSSDYYNCAMSRFGRGGWWYENCDSADLNGEWGVRSDYGVEWYQFLSADQEMFDDDPADFTEMKIRRVR